MVRVRFPAAEAKSAHESGRLLRALEHMAEVRRHSEQASELLGKLQAIDPSLGRMTEQDVQDLRQLRDGDERQSDA